VKIKRCRRTLQRRPCVHMKWTDSKACSCQTDAIEGEPDTCVPGRRAKRGEPGSLDGLRSTKSKPSGPGSLPSLMRRLRPGKQVNGRTILCAHEIWTRFRPASNTSSRFPETAGNAVIRELSRRIFDGRRRRLGALLSQRLAGDPDCGSPKVPIGDYSMLIFRALMTSPHLLLSASRNAANSSRVRFAGSRPIFSNASLRLCVAPISLTSA